jgi:predicted nucleotidyltransferase
VRLQRNEVEFYAFGGQADYRQLLAGVRVPGVDKRLMLIEPTPSGHRESSVVGVESAVAKLLGVSPQTVQERVRVLRKRDRVGRTGIFVKRELDPDEAVGQVMAEEAARNPELRRRVSESTGL